jgi:ribosomal protein L11 methyltransferase
MPWLGLSLELDAAVAEAFSEALLDAGAHSVSLENLDAARPTLQAVLSVGIDPRQVVAAAAQVASMAATPGFSTHAIADADWVRLTQAQFEPIEIGARLWIGPRLVLAFLERLLAGGESVLDYGCGSGILAIAAAKLGAARVDGVDVDPQAVETAAANARANGVAMRAMLPDALAETTYDIVVSNVLAQPLIVLAPLLAGRCRPGGRIALSGILQSQAAGVAAAYDAYFEMSVQAAEDGWVLLEGLRK